MNNSRCPECNRENSYTYFVTVPGGDSLLCKPYRREQFYQQGYSSSSSSSCSSVQPIYCRETINTLSAIVYEESESCTCHIPACFTCPRHDQLNQLFSAVSCKQCDTCSCLCDHQKKLRPNGDICRLAELVDVASSVTDLLKKLKEPKCECCVPKKCKRKPKPKCECAPVQNICLKTVVNKSSCGECLEEEVKSLASCPYDEEVLTCVTPCKRKLKFDAEPPTCYGSDEVCPGNTRKDVNINLFVNVKKEEECPKIEPRKKCKCKKKKEAAKKVCKCDISPAIVICDKKPERHKTFFQHIKAIIPSSKNGKPQTTKCACKEQPIKCACKKQTSDSQVYSVTVCTDGKDAQKCCKRLSLIKEYSSKSHECGKSDKNRSHHSSRSSNKRSSKTEENRNKNEVAEGGGKLEREPNFLQAARPEEAPKFSRKSSKKSSELNTLFVNQRDSSTYRSMLMDPEPKTVQYMFIQTYERFPFKISYTGLEKVSYSIKLRYKSILWLDLTHSDDILKFKKPSACAIPTEWRPLETSSPSTGRNANDKFSQVAGVLEQYQDNDKDLLSIVKKFEEYRNQQRALEELRRRMLDGSREGKAESFFTKRGKKRVVFSRIESECLCRIFCDYIGPLIYLFYLVVFFWVTF